MESQRSNHPLGPAWLLTSILLGAVLVLPGLTQHGLLCNHCPVQYKGKACPNVTSRCRPDERCSSSRWRYGPLHVLSAQGCVAADLCGSHQLLLYRGCTFNVSHACCCEDGCNRAPEPDTYLKHLLGMATAAPDDTNFGNFVNATVQEPQDSCVNYRLDQIVNKDHHTTS